MKMKAVVLTGARNVELKELDELILEEDKWAKIRVRFAGLCGSDLQKIISDIEPANYLKTNVLGHEFSGYIVELKGGSQGFKIGDRVTGIPLISCYSCLPCLEENYQLCENLISIGKDIPGAFAEYLALPVKNLRKIPGTLSYEEAALTDVLASVLHAYHLSNSPFKKNVLVLGDGSIGLTCLKVFRHYLNDVTIVGKHNKDFIQELNNSRFLSLSEVNDLEPDKYDVVVETVGRQQENTIFDSVRLVKPKGKIIVMGVFERGYEGKLCYRDIFYKEATIQGSNSYSVWKGKNEFDKALDMIIKKKIDMSKLITHILPLKNFSDGVSFMNNKDKFGAIKIVYKV